MSRRHRENRDYTKSISLRDLVKNLDVEAEARRLAVSGLPGEHDTQASKELEIIEACVEAINHRRHEISVGSQIVREELAQIPNPDLDREKVRLQARVTVAIMDVFAPNTSEIKTTTREKAEQETQFKAWCDRNKGTLQERTLPECPASKLAHFAPAVAFGLIETAGTSVSLLNSTSAGALGAYVLGLTLTLSTMVPAVFVGLVPLRYFNLRSWKVYLWTVPAFVLGCLAILISGFMGAHYREVASTTRVGFSEQLVLRHMLERPFELGFQSYALLILALSFSVVAAYKGFKASDWHPGFENQWRRKIAKEEPFNELQARLLGKLDEVNNLLSVANEPYEIQGRLIEIRERYERLISRQIRYQTLDAADMSAGRGAIERFRATNAAVRCDGITPNYATLPVTFDHIIEQVNLEELGCELDNKIASQMTHAKEFMKLEESCAAQIERAKDLTSEIMQKIETSFKDENAVPDLSSIREIVSGGNKIRWGSPT